VPMLMTALILAQARMPIDHARHGQEEAEPVCVRAGDLPPAFAAWNAPASPTLVVGKPYILPALSPAGIRWAVPAKPGNGAVASFKIARAGAYRIGLSNGAWIDVVQNGKALRSAAHAHGPVCTGLRKLVEFRLPRGTYVLQLSAMRAAETKVMVVAQ
jgi:hypothetical protein